MYKTLVTALFFALSSFASAQTNDGGISQDMLRQIVKSQGTSPADKAIFNAMAGNSIDNLARNYMTAAEADTHFSVETPSQSITDQKSSGRCWMFSGFNVLRSNFAKKTDSLRVEFSHDYLFFYDQLEKSNLFLQGVIDTGKLPINDPKVQFFFKSPIGDGGTFCGVADLTEKYGLVPKNVMPETFSADNTSKMRSLLMSKLREQGLQLRDMVAQGKSKKQIKEGEPKLAAAAKQLAKGEKDLAAGKKKLADGKAQYAQGLKDYAAAPAKLADGRRQLAEGEAQLQDGYQAYEQGKKDLADGKSKLAEYEDGEQQVRDGLKTLTDTEADLDLQSIASRLNGDVDFDNGDNHLNLDEGLAAVEVGRGYQADDGVLISDEIMARAVGTGALLGAGVLAVLAAIMSFLKKNKGAGILAILAAAAGAFGAFYGTQAGTYFSSIAGSTVGATGWVAAGILGAVALVHAITHFAAKKEA